MQEAKTPSELIDERIEELDDWRGATLARVRTLIKRADPDVVEEWKWVKPTSGGTAVWSHDGGICTGEVHKSVVKLTFFKGASLRTRRASSTRASKGRSGARSTFARARASTRRRSRLSFAPPLP